MSYKYERKSKKEFENHLEDKEYEKIRKEFIKSEIDKLNRDKDIINYQINLLISQLDPYTKREHSLNIAVENPDKFKILGK